MPVKHRKIALMGFRGVGKTSLATQFVEGQFNEQYSPTIEHTFCKTLKVSDEEYQLQLIDTAGQDELSIVPQNYSMNIDGYILVYSLTSTKSFEIVERIHSMLEDKIGSAIFPVILVANKSDLTRSRQVSEEAGQRLAEKWKGTYIETSAKSKENTARIFTTLLSSVEKSRDRTGVRVRHSSGKVKKAKEDTSRCLCS